ncbi:MAG: SDR family oxidoreductase [Mycobacterium sp.]|uniref:SDR family NAD(P)-dependent oxidoreductase n=1 Tax=Mycobacterium sp. TaxID=1785 RepID=UPI003CC518A3
MGNDLAGKVAIVTGGASGLGYATVKKFVAEGARVVVADLDVERGEALAGECGENAQFKRVDVSDAEQVSALVSTALNAFGGLHVMVNNAGISSRMHSSFLRDDLADFNRVMSVNLLGVMLGTREAARHMSEAGGGSIVNVSSIGGIQAGGGVMAYRASKAAVLHFSKCAAIEFASYGIRVNCLAPGSIVTPILESSVQHMSEEVRDMLVKSSRETMRKNRPLEREGTPDDVAEAALYFAGDRSAYLTGTVLPVDGGTVTGTPIRRRAKEAMPGQVSHLT